MRSVASQVFFLQFALILLLVAATVTGLVFHTRHEETEEARKQVLAVAEAFANSPGVVEALDGPNPTAALQPRAEATRKRTGVDSVVVFSTGGIRYTHPDPDRIGKHVIKGDPYKKAVGGEALTDSLVTPLGLTVFAEVPVFRPDGSVAGIVSPEIKVQNVNDAIYGQLPVIFGVAGGALALAAGGSALVSRRLRRQTRGLDPVEITRLYEHHDAVLHSVREGVLIIGGDGRLLLANDEARRLLDLPPGVEQRHIGSLALESGISDLLTSGRPATDEVHSSGDRLLAVNVRTTDQHTGPPGTVATLRDSTELRALAGRAEAVRERLQLLYDAGVRMGVTLDVTRTAEELAEVAVPRFADFVTVDLADPVLHGEAPDSINLLRRTALHGITEEHPMTPVGTLIPYRSTTPQAQGLQRGSAVFDPHLRDTQGWRATDPERAERLLDFGAHSLISAPLQARGVVLGVATFWRSENPESFAEDDVSFAEELVARAALAIDNARRYTREHTMAVTLQRSLLPRTLPEQSALHVAHRYLPTQAGVGGDWFDVIPLPGARVALVVGDVVGHGLYAAATMGRLRTAIHNFSALDLSPDELLTHLDELVARLDTDDAAADEATVVTGATCLYAVYDPISGVCTLARAGHPGPALILPDGTAEFPDVPLSPPLGLGVLPFETTEIHLPEGSQLALYTDGLIESRDRDIDVGFDLLRSALAHPGRTPDQACEAVFEALLPPRPADDVALLIASTRRLDPGDVAEWTVPGDPSAVGRIRAEAARRLLEWDLEDIAFTTELVISELVTNAIRYGTEPISLRLIHDGDCLTCEVSDGSSNSPYLRRAAVTDEGGRGLFLVAQFAERWGTRYTPHGKIIWTEQALHDGAEGPGTSVDNILDQWGDEEL